MQHYTEVFPQPPLARGRIDLETVRRAQPISPQELAGAHLILLADGKCCQISGDRVAAVDDATVMEEVSAGRIVRLGRDPLGRAWFGWECSSPAGTTLLEQMTHAPLEWFNVREVGLEFDAVCAQFAVTLMALMRWHRENQFCGRCGASTRVLESGWVRTCECGLMLYPRTDPVVIALVLDPRGRLLLAHNAAWAGNRVSLLAGYIEPGESVDDAVRREVHEEVGVGVRDVRVLSSQAWPYPRSLMLGCIAYTQQTQLQLNPDEIAWAYWVGREDVDRYLKQGKISLPGTVSIAAHLIRQWRDGAFAV